ncbi:pirin family protein [Mycobacterium sp. SM1]|uniref:pirin family protein n=1 Tax=Mycobacterium sp. SM1 TaxID=2816243 RepID=UPI001BCBA522|nr:pirin family protein [Mycobacterium sp. SM1]MBS4727845.1 pirin family protein [Mycobacterium sp. SM1]
MPAVVEVRRAADRAITKTPWLISRHSFSFGDHYDPRNTHHGVLLVNNDDIVAPAAGFDTHAHRDMEITTWVLQGSLVHQDSAGNRGVINSGLAQLMSAGTGIQHSEKNASATQPVRFVQMWVVPDDTGIAPSYQQHQFDTEVLRNALAPIASGIPGRDAAIAIHNRNAALLCARLDPGKEVDLPAAPYVHLFVARGRLVLEGWEDVDGAGDLAEGDAVRFTAADGRRITASAPSEILVWEMNAALGG